MSTSSPEVRPGLPRWLELVAATGAILLLAPLLLLIAAAIFIAMGRPVLFRQERIGRAGIPFELLKFRTMRSGSGGPAVTAGGDARVTPLGRWLRASKLDELPQLWNVVRGEMSLVGPRPEVARFVDLGCPLWRRVLSSRPGLTDPVSLRLRNEESLLAGVDDHERFYRERLLPYKLELAVEYLDRRTALSDLGVLLRTAASIFLQRQAPTLEEIRSFRTS